MFKAKIATLTAALFLSGALFATPELCPELNAIQAEGITMSTEFFGIFAAYQISHFNTEANWGFVIGPLEAVSNEEAIEIANDILRNMTAPGVMFQEGTCSYETGVPDVFAVAMQDNLPTPLKLRQYITR